MLSVPAIVLAFASCLAIPAAVAADAPPSDASIQQLLDEVHLNALLAQSVDRIRDTIRKATARAWQGRPLNERQQAIIEEMSDRKAELIRKELNWSELRPAIVKVYRENFTQKDVDATIAFYRSPVGQKMIAKQPQIMRQMSDFTLGKMTDLVPQLQALDRETAEKLRAAADDAGNAASPPDQPAAPPAAH
ncbi:MAG TPA: DUF2059 domain-containing protein [Steroidobacteraceae bacterium]|nr:DUF2059 domain-containing protein [Steroidobacteraceae bacterium]